MVRTGAERSPAPKEFRAGLATAANFIKNRNPDPSYRPGENRVSPVPAGGSERGPHNRAGAWAGEADTRRCVTDAFQDPYGLHAVVRGAGDHAWPGDDAMPRMRDAGGAGILLSVPYVWKKCPRRGGFSATAAHAVVVKGAVFADQFTCFVSGRI